MTTSTEPLPLHRGNRLLEGLPDGERDVLLERSRRVSFRPRDTIYERRRRLNAVHFPLEGLGSLVVSTGEGPGVEPMAVGLEGVVGIQVYLDPEMNAGNIMAMCQIAMDAIAVDARDFLAIAARSPVLQTKLRAFASFSFAYAAQSAACNRAHDLPQRCSRWLLECADRVGSRLELTQTFLADMLGVHRPSVTIAMHTLAQAGLIEYERGRVAIANRGALEDAACSCYAVVRGELTRLLE